VSLKIKNMKLQYILIVILIYFNTSYSQVGVYTYDSKATLDIRANISEIEKVEGIIAPRLSRTELKQKDALYLNEQLGMLVYVTDVSGEASLKTEQIVKTGYYFFDGNIWKSFKQTQKYFYLPYFVEELNTIENGKQLDIYNDIYLKQLTKQSNNQFTSNNNELENVFSKQNQSQYQSTDFDYVVIHYDDNVIRINSISAFGIINYDVINLNTGIETFINIVLVVK